MCLLSCFLCTLPWVLVLWCWGEGSPIGHTWISSLYRFFTLLGLALPLTGTAYVAARAWGSDHGASSTLRTHSATYGSLPLRETERSESRSRIQWPGGLAILSGTPNRGKSRHFNKLPFMRGDLDEDRTGREFPQCKV